MRHVNFFEGCDLRSYGVHDFNGFFSRALAQHESELGEFSSAINNDWFAPAMQMQNWRRAIGPFSTKKAMAPKSLDVFS